MVRTGGNKRETFSGKVSENRSIVGLRALAFLSLILLIASLIPVFIGAVYAHPVADDYSFSYLTYQALRAGGNFADIILAAIEEVQSIYFSWQGTFSAVFLFSLQPGVLGSSWYRSTTFILVIALFLSTLCFFDSVFCWLDRKEHISCSLLYTSLLLLVEIQFLPSVSEGLYWFNGAIYYTFFYSALLLLLSCIFRLMRRLQIKAAEYILLIILAFLIGGGNFSTALVGAEILVLLSFLLFLHRQKGKGWKICLIAIALMLGMLISILAPGNQVRAGMMQGMSASAAIGSALIQAGSYIKEWTKLPQVGIAVLFMPLANQLAAECNTRELRKSFSRRCRVAISLSGVIACYCLFASQIVPPLYAMSDAGAGRQIDIYYYSYYLLLVAEESCILMLFHAIHENGCGGTSQSDDLSTFFRVINRRGPGICILVALVFLAAGCVSYGLGATTSGTVAKVYLKGELQEYAVRYREIDEKLLYASESDQTSVVLPEIPPTPACYEYFDLSAVDPDYWGNRALARYYGLQRVTFEEPGGT